MAAFSPKVMMEKLDEALAEKNVITNYLDIVEKKTNVKKRYLVLGIAGFLGLWLASGYMAAFICNLVGFAYPAYKSVKAIESANKDDDTEWLMYWVVFATFSVVEFFSDLLLSWFPFYFLGKCVFLLWCMAPVSWNGSAMLYKKTIRPFILRNENKIDSVLDRVGAGAKELVDKAAKDGKEMAADVAADVVSTSLKKDE
uniref:Receptor expression-enhancing protein n=1 Tax=Phallusia mammillata TaxID=59560 RepID=A0A6F9DR93_9ASCI|nr:receptor expression-enhancing protein 5-like [Phallusia mammillata]